MGGWCPTVVSVSFKFKTREGQRRGEDGRERVRKGEETDRQTDPLFLAMANDHLEKTLDESKVLTHKGKGPFFPCGSL